MRDVGDHLRHEPGLGGDTDRFRGTSDRLLELVRGKRRNRLRSFREQRANARIDQGTVVEICPEGDDHPETALGVGGGHPKRLEEQLPLSLVVRQRENLLELVHEQDDVRPVGRDKFERVEQSPRSLLQPGTQTRHRTHRDPK
jgi:hypothetical protein